MKKNIVKYSFILVLLASCEALISFNTNTGQVSADGNKDIAILNSVLYILEKDHLSPVSLDDSMSNKMFELYIEQLDYNKRFLLKEDYDTLNSYRYKLDDQIKGRKFDFFDLSFNLIQRRIKQVNKLYPKFLKRKVKMDDGDRELNLDSDKFDYASSRSDLEKRWCDYLTYNVFHELNNKELSQQERSSKSDTITIKSFKVLEAEAREKISENHKQWFKRIAEVDRDARLSSYINCLTEVYDPHTNFYPPRQKEEFDISMSGTLEGIGATLQQKEGYTKVTQIVPGSASWKQGDLKEGDVILKVAQKNEEPVSIVDMPLSDAVRLIRGPKGSEVRLTVKKIDGKEVIIPIIRDVVILEESYAKSAIINDTETKTKTGYIYLPTFYADFNNLTGRRCATDVKKEVEKLKKDNVDGIIIDLRNNGGGSLRDVVEMGGLFVQNGPIVQVKGKVGSARVLSDYDPTLVYAGPLVIMINQNSASASEILAAAMQDYKRAIIVGSRSSYGKGTVQRFDNLDRYLPTEDRELAPTGSIKYTMQKFYRINGGATQLKGVESDIVIPDNFMYIETGEKERNNAMPWDEIPKASYDSYESYVGDFDKIISNSNNRIANDTVFQQYEKRAKYYEKVREENTYPLTYETFKNQMKTEKANGEQYLEKRMDLENLQVISPSEDLTSWGTDTTKTARFDAFAKKIKKDNYINESIKIIKDIILY